MIIKNHDWTTAYRIEANFRYIISEQEAYGWFMDQDKLNEVQGDLEKKLMRVENEIIKLIPKQIINQKELKKPLKKDGTPSVSVKNWYNELDIRMFPLKAVVGVFTKISIEEVNLNSPPQKIKVLRKLGWKPSVFNYVGGNKPIYAVPNEYRDADWFIKNRWFLPNWYVNSLNVKQKIITSPSIKPDKNFKNPILEMMVLHKRLSHRLGLICGEKGFKALIREDGSIGGGGNTVAANTGRMRHRNIVNVPSVKDGAFYAEEIRSCFSHREGYTLIGADLNALENRLMGHYTWGIDNGKYAKRLMEEDPHDRTAKILNIDRNTSKTVNYAMSFGCTFHKLKEILNCTDKEAKQKHKAWWEDKKPLLILKSKLVECTGERKPMWIKGLDGRKVFCRSKHSLLNALIQSAGSVVNKFITCCVYKEMKEKDVDGHLILNYHDEIDLEVKNDKKTIDITKEIIYNSISKCNKYFKFKIPMEMDIKVGKNWKEIH